MEEDSDEDDCKLIEPYFSSDEESGSEVDYNEYDIDNE